MNKATWATRWIARPAIGAPLCSRPAVSRVAAAAVACGFALAVAMPSFGQGLPFTEEFDDADLSDDARTRAEWGTGELKLPSAEPLTASFGTVTAGEDVGAVPYITRSLALADMDGDGDLDLVEGAADTNGVYLNGDGLGTFSTRVPITTDAANTRGIGVADMDGDGDLDVVAGNFNAPVRLYLNAGDGVQWIGSDISIGIRPVDSVAVADFNGDGNPDVATAIQGNNSDRVYFNTGNPVAPFGTGLEGQIVSPRTDNGQTVLAGDVDNDGDIDLVVINETQENRLHLNVGNGTFSAGTAIGVEIDNSQGGALGDLNGDGFLDLVVGNYPPGEINKIYFNSGDPAAPFSAATPAVAFTAPGDPNYVHDVTLGDADNDGDLDILLGTAGVGAPVPGTSRFANRVYVNDGSGGFATFLEVDADMDVTNNIVIGDVDGDGDGDIIAGNEGRDAANGPFAAINRLYRNTGTAAGGAEVRQLSGYAASLRVDEETSEIATITLNADPVSSGLHNQADYWVSSNGGVNWLHVVPGRPAVFPEGTRGMDLRWRVVLNSLSPASAEALALKSVSLTRDAPAFTSEPVTEATVDTEYSYAVEATDPDADPLTLTAPTVPAWLTLTDNGDGTGTLAGTPTAADAGTHEVVLEVTDGTATTTQSFTITVTGVNAAPAFTSTPVTAATEGTAYSYEVTATDPDAGDTLTFTASTLPAWLTLTDNGDGTGTLAGTPTAAEVGDHDVVLEVADASGESAAQVFTITVAGANGGPTNTAPAFTSSGDTTGTAGTAYTYEIEAEDADAGDTLTLTAPTLPDWLALTDNGDGTGTLTGTPAAGHVGDHEVVLEVADAAGETAEQSFTITVAAASPPPSNPTPPPSNSGGGGGGSAGPGDVLGLLFLAGLLGLRRRVKAG